MLQATFWDRLGIWISGLCALHCLLLPISLALMPLWPSLTEVHEWVHPLLAVLLIPVTLKAMRGIRRGPAGRPIALLLGIGLALVLLAWAFHDVLGLYGEPLLTLLGSALLILGHWRNWQQHRSATAITPGGLR